MIDTEQYLLIKLAEEASEIAQIALKAAQFGLQESYKTDTNAQRLCDELSDLATYVRLLNSKHSLGHELTDEYYAKKIDKMLHYWEYSAELGKTEEPEI